MILSTAKPYTLLIYIRGNHSHSIVAGGFEEMS